MSTIKKIQLLAALGDVQISEHGYDELANDNLLAGEIVRGIEAAVLVEDYPKGASILVLQKDKHGQPVHVVWGIPKGEESPAVVVTAYRPDPERWNISFTERKR